MNRRQAIGSIAGAVAATAAATRISYAKGEKPALTPVAPGTHKPVALPFNPGKLPGLSEKLLASHHDNNYAGAIKNLNAVELELDKVTKDTPGFQVAALRERELNYANSAYLHERYFENLGGDYTFSDDGLITLDLATGQPRPSGLYSPYSPLAAFHGLDAAGDWVLTISDNAFLDTGRFEGWNLDVNTYVPEPATWALLILGFGAVGAAMRRRGLLAA